MFMDYDIRKNESESRFETTVDGHTAFSQYSLAPGRITFLHTEVPEALAGRGIANHIVQFALEHARDEELEVIPACSFVAKFIQRHPEYSDLVAPS
jgi:predicted GNAT family acetyltransferase